MTAQRPPVTQAVRALSGAIRAAPRVGIICGSGLGDLAGDVRIIESVNYGRIPGFPISTALGHAGRLLIGSWCDTSVLVLQGRTHLYEGYDVSEVTFPVRVLHSLGVQRLVLTNAAGGLNPRFSVGDMVVINDHIDCTGARLDAAGSDAAWHCNHNPRLYDPALIELVLAVCRREGFAAHRGTYVAVTGPNYETRAEYRMFRGLGGDVIGMSTVPEALVAAGLGLEVVAISTVANVCNPDRVTAADGCDVVSAATQAERKLRTVVREIVVEGGAPAARDAN